MHDRRNERADLDDPLSFWAGKFGNDYIQRNQVDWMKRVPFFRKIIQLAMPTSVLEVGCNCGQNLRAINHCDNIIDLAGCDVNESAIETTKKLFPLANIELCPAADIYDRFTIDMVKTMDRRGYSLVMTAGLLIHIPPEELQTVMQAIVEVADDYVLAIEYDNNKEEEINYRGHEGKLWKRPYSSLYMELGLEPFYQCKLGPDEGFGEGCTAWLMRKIS